MISKQDKKFLEKIIKKFDLNKKEDERNYPLLEKGFTNSDIMRGIEVLLSRKITMSNLTKKQQYINVITPILKTYIIVNAITKHSHAILEDTFLLLWRFPSIRRIGAPFKSTGHYLNCSQMWNR